MTHPVKFRRHVLRIRTSEGLTYAQTSERFKVGIASLTRWNKDIEPKAYVRKKRKLDLEKLTKDVQNNPDDYQFERAARFGVCQKSIWQALKKLGVTYKKSVASPKGKRRHAAYLPGQNPDP